MDLAQVGPGSLGFSGHLGSACQANIPCKTITSQNNSLHITENNISKQNFQSYHYEGSLWRRHLERGKYKKIFGLHSNPLKTSIADAIGFFLLLKRLLYRTKLSMPPLFLKKSQQKLKCLPDISQPSCLKHGSQPMSCDLFGEGVPYQIFCISDFILRFITVTKL